MLQFKQGNLFEQLPEGRILIPHICNNIHAFGSGFAGFVAKAFPTVRQAYMNWKEDDSPPFELGQVQFVKHDLPLNELIFANMIGQNGLIGPNNPTPIKYNAVESCIEIIANKLTDIKPDYIIGPKFGSERAGGNFDIIQPMVEKHWKDYPVWIFTL